MNAGNLKLNFTKNAVFKTRALSIISLVLTLTILKKKLRTMGGAESPPPVISSVELSYVSNEEAIAFREY